jgi:aspartate ammonia-lyase
MEIEALLKSMDTLREAFARKGREFSHILKMGRTQLQDAVPMTLGDEFTAYSVTMREDIQRLKEAQQLVTEINLGATAIGTMINAPEGYPELGQKLPVSR